MHVVGRLSDSELPRPQKVVQANDLGLYFVVAVALEGWKDGYDAVVEDIYKRQKGQWIFTKRQRRFFRTSHYGLDGKPFDCAECATHWEKNPNPGPEEIKCNPL